MKKIFILIMIIIACLLAVAGFFLCKKNKNREINNNTQSDKLAFNDYDSHWLRIENNQIKNQSGKVVRLKGLSSHGIQWYSEVITYDNLKQLKEEWEINVFRVAMYTNPKIGGYIADKEKSKEKVCRIVDMATELDMYVIIDWHTLADNNPCTYQEDSKKFFDEMSQKYANNPYVIYEICNEPNGKNVTWEKFVKPYAEQVIPVIRKNSPKSLIIVGTPDWCKDLQSAAEDPLDYENVMYSCHFYAGSHGNDLREKINYSLEKNIPIIISECGITDISGNGKIYEEEFATWIEYLNQKNLSYIYWSFCSKDEASSILRADYPIKSDEEMEEFRKNHPDQQVDSANIDDYLSSAGKFIKSRLKK